MKIRTLLSEPKILSVVKQKFQDVETFSTLDLLIEQGGTFDVLLIDSVILDDIEKIDNIKGSFRTVYLNLSGKELTDEQKKNLVKHDIYDFNESPSLKASEVISFLETPKSRKEFRHYIEDGEKTKIEIEKEVVKIKTSGTMSFFGVKGVGITTAAIYFASRLSKSLEAVGDKSKVLLMDMSTNPKSGSYLGINDIDKSLQKLYLVAEEKGMNFHCKDYVHEVESNFHFMDGIKDYHLIVNKETLLKIINQIKGTYSYVIFINDDLRCPLSKVAIENSTHSYLVLDMNVGNLDYLKDTLHFNRIKPTAAIFQNYREVSKYSPNQFMDVLSIQQKIIIKHDQRIVDYANNGKLLGIDASEEVDALVGEFVTIMTPKKPFYKRFRKKV